MNETKLQAPIRIKIDYKRPGKAERDCIEVVAEEFAIPGAGKHRFAVHGSVVLPGEFTASHIETGFSLASGETIEKAIELAREKWAAADPEKISLAIIRARNHTKVKHAAPAPATWSSATAPGPDGMQHCIAVPGMPSAARDAAYDEIAALAVEWADAAAVKEAYHALRNFAEHVVTLKSIAGPVADARPPSAHDDISAQLREYASNPGYSHNDYADTMRQAADAIDAGLDAIRAWSAPAPVQQAAPSEPDAYMAVLSGGEPVSVNFQKIHADWKLKEWEGAGEVVPLYRAAPAQPVGLSEQDRLDAARVECMYQHACVKPFIAPVVTKEAWLARIDAAILAAKEAP